MDEHTLLNTSNIGLLAANFIVGFATMEAVNLAVAVSGAAVTILANLDRVAYSIVRIRELAANGWRIPKENPAASDGPDTDNEPTTDTE